MAIEQESSKRDEDPELNFRRLNEIWQLKCLNESTALDCVIFVLCCFVASIVNTIQEQHEPSDAQDGPKLNFTLPSDDHYEISISRETLEGTVEWHLTNEPGGKNGGWQRKQARQQTGLQKELGGFEMVAGGKKSKEEISQKK